MKKTRISMKYYVKTVGLTAMLFVICLVWTGAAYSAACIQVTAPNGGETLVPGSSKTISWTYDSAQGPGSLVKIELLKGGLASTTIIASAGIGSSGNGSRNWMIPAQQAGGTDYSIRVTSLTKPVCTDTSDGNFNVYSLKLKAPNGGENWVQASKNIISWANTGWPPGEKVRLELWKDGALTGTITELNAGSLLWFTGSMGPTNQYTWGAPGPGYKIKIVSLTTNLSDMSDGAFTITPPTIHLTSPNGGESWVYYSTHPITWTSSGIRPLETVKVELLKGGSPIGSLGGYTSYEPQTSFNWKTGTTGGPYAPVANDFKVRVTTTSSNISDESDGFFTIAPSTIKVTSPNGGESWRKETIRQITWISEGCTDSSNVRIDLNGTGGCNLANSIPTKQGSYSWTVGNCANGSKMSATGSDYKIRITPEGGCSPTSVTDTSDGTFTISPAIKVLQPAPLYKK